MFVRRNVSLSETPLLADERNIGGRRFCFFFLTVSRVRFIRNEFSFIVRATVFIRNANGEKIFVQPIDE